MCGWCRAAAPLIAALGKQLAFLHNDSFSHTMDDSSAALDLLRRSDDAAGPDPGPSSSGDGRRGGESGVSVGGGEASAEGVETDGPKAPPSLETHGWVAWPPPNPPPPA